MRPTHLGCHWWLAAIDVMIVAPNMHMSKTFFSFLPAKWFLSVELVPIMLICAQSQFDQFSCYKKKGFKHDRQLMKTTGWISMNFPMNIYKSIITSVTTGDVNLLFFRLYWDLQRRNYYQFGKKIHIISKIQYYMSSTMSFNAK